MLFAAVTTMVGIATVLSRTDPWVTWPLVLSVVLLAWIQIWATWLPIWTVAVPALTVPVVLNLVTSKHEVSFFFAITAICLISSSVAQRWLAGAATMVFAAVILVLTLARGWENVGVANWLIGAAFAWGFGEVVFRYHLIITELQQTRALAAERAVAEERNRIARDIHDLVGHSLSVVLLHVTGARHIIRSDPDEAERALEQAEGAGRSALSEIRGTMELLKTDADGDAPAQPSPDLRDIEELVAQYAMAGIDVSLSIDGDVSTVDKPAALAGYRIVQEALTNASRHRPDSSVQVDVDLRQNDCRLSITNVGGDVGNQKGAGFGITSMTERARSVGGVCIAGPMADGWTVEAVLPISTVGLRT